MLCERVYTPSFAMHVLGWGVVVLGMCGGKTGRRRRFGYFGGGSARNNRSGIGDKGALLSVPLL
jgi:hypothetical protein